MQSLSQSAVAHDAERVLELIERQQSLAQELEHLAMQQSYLIEHSETSALLDLLAKRQGVIDSLLAAQGEMRTVAPRLERAELSDSLRSRLNALIDDVSRRLEVVMAVDERDKASLRIERDAVRTELSAAGTAQQARNAYLSRGQAASQPVGNRFSDHKG